MSSEGRKVFTFQQVSKHNNSQDCWIIIKGKVYNVTDFLDDHPGGDDMLLQVTGTDATDNFEDVGHSNNARNVMKEFYVGDVDLSTLPAKTFSIPSPGTQTTHDSSSSSSGVFIKLLQFLIAFGILAAAYLYSSYPKSDLGL